MQATLLSRGLAVAFVEPVHEMALIDHDRVVVCERTGVAQMPAQMLFGADAIRRQEGEQLRILWRQRYSPRRRVRRVGKGTVSNTAMLLRMASISAMASCHFGGGQWMAAHSFTRSQKSFG